MAQGNDQAASVSKKGRASFALLALSALFVLFFAGLGRMSLTEPDEGRYTEIPREMLATGQYLLPHLNGVLYFEKPPLYYWLNALSIKTFGLNEFAARFWSAALGFLGLLLVYALARRMAGRRAALLSAAVLGTSPLYLAMAHLTTIDMTLTFFFTLTLVCFYFAQEDHGRVKHERFYWYAMFVGAALTVMSKGLIGIVLPGAIIGLYLLFSRRWFVLKRVPWVTGILLFLAIAAPWHVVVAMKNDRFLWFYFVREHFLRYLTKLQDRYEPFWFFLPVLAWGLLPWTALLPSSFLDFIRKHRPGKRHARAVDPTLFLWLWAIVIVVFFSASDSKLIPYILPALPAFAILAALALDTLLDESGWMRRSLLFFIVTTLLGTAVAGGALLAAGFGAIHKFSPGGGFFPWLALAGTMVVVPALAGCGFAAVKRWRSWILATVLCAGTLFAGIWLVALHVNQGGTMEHFAHYLEIHVKPGDRIFSYRYYPQTLPVYLQRTIGVAAFEGEQAFGVSNLPEKVRRERFPNALEFSALWKSAVRIYCVTDNVSIKYLQADHIGPVYTLLHERNRYILTNHAPNKLLRNPHD